MNVMVERGTGVRCCVPLIVLCCAFALAGCGGGDGDEDGTTSESSQPASTDTSTNTPAESSDASTNTPASVSTNNPPTLTGAPATSILVGSEYAFAPDASDPDGDALLFGADGLPQWAEFDSLTGTISGSPGIEDVGTYQGVAVWVTDGEAQTRLPAFDIAVSPLVQSVPNAVPTISGTPAQSVVAGETYRFVPQGSDPDGEALSFTIRNCPSWATFDPASGTLEGIPSVESAGKYIDIVIAATDGHATTTLPPFEITVTLLSVNTAPTITGSPDSRVLEGTNYAFAPSASDVNGDALSFSIANKPRWASFDSSSGRLAGTPGAHDVGLFANIVVSVSDGVATAALPAFSISVEATNAAPTISGTPAAAVVQGNAYSFKPDATDLDGDVLTFEIANLPAWATFDQATGQLTGTPGPADIGFYSNIRISVTDNEAEVALPAFSIEVGAVWNGTATLSWTAPTLRTDGSALTNLAGFNVYWGQEPGNYSNKATVGLGITTFVIDALGPGTWYFVATAFDTDDQESTFSNMASKVIQ